MIEGIRVAEVSMIWGRCLYQLEIVTKPGALTPFEFSVIKEHPQKVMEMLKESNSGGLLPEIVLQHHERLGWVWLSKISGQ